MTDFEKKNCNIYRPVDYIHSILSANLLTYIWAIHSIVPTHKAAFLLTFMFSCLCVSDSTA